MGPKFGNLATINRIVYFRISPHEQKSFKGFFAEGAPNLARRVFKNVVRISPVAIYTYMLMAWADEQYYLSTRKDESLYANDV